MVVKFQHNNMPVQLFQTDGFIIDNTFYDQRFKVAPSVPIN